MGGRRRGLLHFDLSAVPSGATVETVTLNLLSNRSSPFAGGPTPLRVHLLQEDWGEGASTNEVSPGQGAAALAGDATWTNRFHPGLPWASAGGTFVGTPSATTNVDGVDFVNVSSAGLAADVQGWLDSPGQNFGWILLGGETQAYTAKRFNAREGAANRPSITVQFTPPPVGSPFCFGTGCPCGNDSPPMSGTGCVNSTGQGALLSSTGSASVAADDLVLTTTGSPPNNTGLYFMGGATFSPVFVGDGLGCTGGLFRFFPSVVSPSGVFTLSGPVALAPPGAITAGDTRHFQSWTRDVLCGPPPAPCPTPCGQNSNLSNGYSVVFVP